jgi:glycogen debranching enzyme
MNIRDFRQATRDTLEANTRTHDHYTYTVPSPELYPFQWLWDSCFHAVMWNALGIPERAAAELTAAVAKPLPSGLLPHITYWQQLPDGVVWGREARSTAIDQAWGTKQTTSSLTQPPLIARVVLETYQETRDDTWLRQIYPTLTQFYEAIQTTRTWQQTGLPVIINPDESGEDNSPRFDAALGLPPQHSADRHLDARLTLIKQYAATGRAAIPGMRETFMIIDVGFVMIYKDGLDAMAGLAHHLSDDVQAAAFTKEARSVAHSARQLLCGVDGRWQSYDCTLQARVPVRTWHEFMPLFAGVASVKEAASMTVELQNKSTFAGRYGVRTTSRTEPAYDPDQGFWRGPVWAAPHWFIARGLLRYGEPALAQKLGRQLMALTERSGWREQYQPETGESQGARDFTWNGLALDIDRLTRR